MTQTGVAALGSPGGKKLPCAICMRRMCSHCAVDPITGTSRLRPPKEMSAEPTASGATRFTPRLRVSASASSSVRSRGVCPRNMRPATPAVSLRPGNTITRLVPERGELVHHVDTRTLAETGEDDDCPHSDCHGDSHQHGAAGIAAQTAPGIAQNVLRSHGLRRSSATAPSSKRSWRCARCPSSGSWVTTISVTPLLVQRLEDLHDVLARAAVEVAGGLVGEQQPRAA